jgi:amino acid transporter
MSRVDDSPRLAARPPAHAGGLRTRHLVGLLIATHTPVTLLWVVVPIAFSSGVVATPLIFALAGLILLGFVLGYSGLGRRIRHPGGLYVQVAKGLGRPAGLGAAGLLFVGYIGLVVGLYGLSARTLKELVAAIFHVNMPSSLALVVFVVAVLGISRLKLLTLSRVMILVVGVQILSVLWFAYAVLDKPASGQVSYAAVDPGWLLSGSFGVVMVFACTAFIGSEGASGYSDELEDPQRSVPRATYVSYTVTTAVLVIGAWPPRPAARICRWRSPRWSAVTPRPWPCTRR